MASAAPCLPDIDKLKTVRDGTEQVDRFQAPLDPETVPVHGREPAESMLFARAYAEYLRYYSTADVTNGDWTHFFGRDVSVALASVAVQDVTRYRRVILACIDALEDLDNAGSPDVVRQNLGWIFGAVGTLARQIDLLKERLPGEIALRATLVNLITTRLAAPLRKLIAYANHDASLAPADRLLGSALIEPKPHDDYDVSILGVAPSAFGDVLSGALSTDWTGGIAWTTFVSPTDARGTAPDGSVFGATGSVFERANRCAKHNQFTGACDQFLKAYARLVSDAAAELDMTLESWDKHDPHYALFLAFLWMFEYARADINLLSGKHLDFYYREVLQLAERPAEPSKAHVVVELAKNTATHELPAGTEFKAGKDAKKVAVVFKSDDSLVANKAAVTSLKNLCRDFEADAIYVNANAKADEGSWHPFQTDSQIGSLGFSVASHYLYLGEGTRTVTLKVAVSGVTEAHTLTGVVCRFTTAKGWLDVPPKTCRFTDASKPEMIEITVELDGDAPAITAFDAKVHAAAYDVALPIMEVRLTAAQDKLLTTFEALESVLVRSIELTVRVTGLRSLVLSTDLGPADASKPFQPFGPAPSTGSSLIVGCQEAFSKRGILAGSVKLNLTWRNFSKYSLQASTGWLVAGQWKGASEATLLVDASETLVLPDVAGAFNSTDDPSVKYPAPFSLKATSGYMKLSLWNASALGHETYASRLVAHVISSIACTSSTVRLAEMAEAADASKSPELPSALPPEPYTPELESITLDYAATQTIECDEPDAEAFKRRTARFYHVSNFGVSEQHPLQRVEGVYLVPQLRHLDALGPGAIVRHEGELYIGLSGVVAPRNVALLFQVEDGTADPLTEKPDPHLHFSYLRNGDWIPFERDEVEDRTSELLASGIIRFAVPEDATVKDTLLPGGLTWIRIAAGEGTRAVCRLLAVTAQAVQATFDDRRNDPAFLATPLAAGTIAKLLTPVAGVKAVAQPFESFGGRVAEAPRAFRTRVSERLRHKDRAIALWDIEHLVLEAFPGIHRVKCLNHTRYEPNKKGDGIYHELAAGHVTVVTIPAVSKGYAADPLQPYTSLGVLRQVKAFLEERLSCFATLHVRNPAYEQLRVSFKVRLRGGCDEAHSITRLKTAIARFLAPWAFDPDLRPSFGGKVYRSSLIDFIEDQACVDYVTDFELFHDAGGAAGTVNKAVIEGTRAVSVLTSVPEVEHVITVIDEAEADATGERCGCPE
jgi:hypothetical protein